MVCQSSEFSTALKDLLKVKQNELRNEDVSGILSIGGTILGSSNKGDPFHWPVELDGKIEIVDKSQNVLKIYKALDLDAVIAIGGDGTMHICNKLAEMGMNIIGVPKTIDNDLEATDMTFGHDSAVYVVIDGIRSFTYNSFFTS